MTTTKVGIELEVRLNKADEQIKRLTGEVEKLRNSSEKAGQATGKAGMSKSFEDMVGKAQMAAAAVTAVAFAFDKLSDRSLKFQAIQAQVTVGINQARDATMGLVSDFDLMRLSNEAVRDGLIKTEADFAKMSGLATRLGLSVGKDAKESIELFSNALDKLSPKSLDALGLAVDKEQAYYKYASSLGKTAEMLTEVEQRQAITNAAFEDGEAKLAGMNAQVDQGALAFQQMKTDVINLADQGFVYVTSKIGEAGDALGDFLSDWADFAAETGLNGMGGINAADGNNYFRTQRVRGLGGIPGVKGEAARAEAARVKEAEKSLAVQRKTVEEGRLANNMWETMARANDKVTDALEKQNKAHKKKIDLHKAERAEFRSQFGEVEMGRASTGLSNAMARDSFNDQLGEAKMVEAGMEARKRQMEFEEETHKKRVERNKEMESLFKAEADAIKKAEEDKRDAMKKTEKVREQLLDHINTMTSASVQLSSMAADAFIKGGKRKDTAMRALAASEMVVVGITETVKAVAAFAGFNYIEGAAHTAAAILAYAQAAKLGGGGGAGGGVGGGNAGAFATPGAFGGGTDTGGSTQSSSGGGSRPSNNGPVSEAEESVQRSGRGGRPGPTRNRNADGPAPVLQLVHFGQLDDQSLVKIDQGLTRIRRKSGKNSS